MSCGKQKESSNRLIFTPMKKRVEEILCCPLFDLIKCSNPGQVTSDQLTIAFAEYHNLIREITDGTSSFSEKYRILTVAMAYVHGIKAPPNIPASKHIIKIAKECVKAELDLLNKRILYPDLFSQLNTPPPSPLHWNTSKFSKRDLIELVSALFAAQAIVDSDGNPVSFIQITQHLGNVVNIHFPNNTAYNEREYIRSVKRNTTAFISQLANSLVEK